MNPMALAWAIGFFYAPSSLAGRPSCRHGARRADDRPVVTGLVAPTTVLSLLAWSHLPLLVPFDSARYNQSHNFELQKVTLLISRRFARALAACFLGAARACGRMMPGRSAENVAALSAGKCGASRTPCATLRNPGGASRTPCATLRNPGGSQQLLEVGPIEHLAHAEPDNCVPTKVKMGFPTPLSRHYSYRRIDVLRGMTSVSAIFGHAVQLADDPAPVIELPAEIAAFGVARFHRVEHLDL